MSLVPREFDPEVIEARSAPDPQMDRAEGFCDRAFKSQSLLPPRPA